MHLPLVGNRYALATTLGIGGMGRVYLAHDNILRRDVALKVLRDRYAESEEFVERFRREARSAARLNHPNIASVYDLGHSGDGTYHIAMEYVSGGTLKDRIVAAGSLDPSIAADLGSQVAEALGFAHERGVIHRDVKPENILLTTSGDAKVVDFGIARAATASTISQTGHILGTARYMSPEQAMGEPVGPASDLYSLGLVLYETLTGEVPFKAETLVAVALKHVEELPRPPKEVNPNVPDGMNALILKLLAKKPEDRYRSAAELTEDLRRVRDGLPSLLSSAPVPAEGSETNRTVALGSLATSVPGDAGKKHPATPHQSARGNLFRRPRFLVALLAALLLPLLGALAFWELRQDNTALSSPGSAATVEPDTDSGASLDEAGDPSNDLQPNPVVQAVPAAAAEVNSSGYPAAITAASTGAQDPPASTSAQEAPASTGTQEASVSRAPPTDHAPQTPAAAAAPATAADTQQAPSSKVKTPPKPTGGLSPGEKPEEGDKTPKKVEKKAYLKDLFK